MDTKVRAAPAIKPQRRGEVEAGKESAEVAIGHPKPAVGHFCFPPESLRPESRYASAAVSQGRGRGKQGRQDCRAGGEDCLTHLQLLRDRPEVLANALRDMGVTESGDEVSDHE